MRPLAIAGLVLLTSSAIACEHASVRPARDAGGGEDAAEQGASAEEEASSSDDAMQDEGSEDAMQDESSPDAGTDEDAAADAGAPAGDSFASARPIELGGPGILTDETSAEQVDYYVFHGEAGHFYELATNRHSFSPDNTISLYDADQNLIAENDDGWLWPSDSIDARLVVRLPETGDYFVRVEDPWTPAEFFGSGGFRLLYYTLHVRELDPDTDTEGFVFAPHEQAIRFRKDEASGFEYATIVGQFGEEPGLVTFPGLAGDLVAGHVHTSGSSAGGSSAHGGRVRISTSDQGLIVAEIDRAKGQEFIHPPVSDLSYQLAVYADGPLGDNPFFAIDVVLVPDNPHELADAANDQLAGAEPVALTGSFRRRGLLLSTLGAGDVDYYSIQVGAGEHVAVACEGESAGSGVRALRVELRDASDAVLGASEESAAQSLRSEPVLVAAAGTYYLRLSSGASEQAPAVEPWARCSLAVGP